jgi:2-iminobutanoate/2-iminopropanoate deaminase
MRRVACLLPLLVACACVGHGGMRPDEHGPALRFDRSPETAAADLPFSDAVRAGDLLFVSGQLGVRPGTAELVPGGIEAETRQCLENVRAILERNGSGLARIVKCTAFLADMDEWPRMNAVYRTFFPEGLPARSALGVDGLAFGARIELECIAAVGTGAPAAR